MITIAVIYGPIQVIATKLIPKFYLPSKWGPKCSGESWSCEKNPDKIDRLHGNRSGKNDILGITSIGQLIFQKTPWSPTNKMPG